MPTLLLSAPRNKAVPGTISKDFYEILASGVGPDYGITSNQLSQIGTGMNVVVFDSDRELQAEGVVATYTRKEKADNGVWRYDAGLSGMQRVPYTKPPKVNRFGVEVV
jgi:hypothetical protein